MSKRSWWKSAGAGLAGLAAVSCGGDDAPPPADPGPPLPQVAAQSGAQRLSAAQYRNSVQGVLGQDIVVPTALEPDVAKDGFVAVNNSFATLSGRGIEQYEKASFTIAQQALAPERRARLLSCTPAATRDDVCARSTLTALGRRLWRRPLETSEVDPLVEISGKAATVLGDFTKGLEYGVATLLQSPSFLYRTTLGEPDPQHPERRRATAHEMASRLSYFLWNTTPDDELLDAAQSGALVDDAGLRQQAERLLDDPRARQGARAFFSEYLGLGDLDTLSKDPKLFTYFSPEVGPAAREETLRLFEHFVFDLDADYRDLFTTRQTFVNPKLASMYGIQAPNLEGFGLTEHPTTTPRKGLLGHISLLALYAHPVSSSATLRGRFIRTRLLCAHVPDPPVNVNTALPEPSPELATLRQRVDKHLTAPSCAGCHIIMDPIGLGLENFDGIGRFRHRENDVDIDASGELDGRTFAGPDSLADAVHDHPELGPCFVRNLHRYATAFPETDEDQDTLAALTHDFRASGHRVRSLMLALSLSPAFRLAREPK